MSWNKATTLRHLALGLGLLLAASCSAPPASGSRHSTARIRTVALEEIVQAEVAEINRDVLPGPLTMNVAIIFPSNLDPSFKSVSVEQLLDGIRFAKEVFRKADVQIRLLWVKTGPVDPSSLSIMESMDPGMPASRHVGTYTRLRRHPAVLSDHARSVFESVIAPDADNHRTLYLVVLQDVFMPHFAERGAGDSVFAVTPTSGMSFPGYMFGQGIPRRLRGVITITNLTRGKNPQKTIAHEIGHKVINVSHEYLGTAPGFEVVGEGGLMIYGSGIEIPAGRDGRWHRERLELSPFLYRTDPKGRKKWNPDYADHGHYFDPIYGDHYVSETSPP